VLLLIRGTEAKWTTYKPVGVIKLDGSMEVVPLIKGHVLDLRMWLRARPWHGFRSSIAIRRPWYALPNFE